MLIAIISDSHDNLPNIDEAIRLINQLKIKTIIHCGDLSSVETLKYLSKNFTGQIHLVEGNNDGDYAWEIKKTKIHNITFYGKTGTMEILDKKIGFAHLPAEAKKMAATNNYQLIFHGHIHKPWEKLIGQTRLVNPGTLAGMFTRPTFAIYNAKTDELKLKILYS